MENINDFDFDGHNPTVYPDAYTARMYDRYGDPDRYFEMREEARDLKQCMIREGFLDDLGFDRSDPCRDCPWMKEGVIELFEDDVDDDMVMPGEAYDLAERMCAVCKAHTAEERDDVLLDFFKKEDERQ